MAGKERRTPCVRLEGGSYTDSARDWAAHSDFGDHLLRIGRVVSGVDATELVHVVLR